MSRIWRRQPSPEQLAISRELEPIIAEFEASVDGLKKLNRRLLRREVSMMKTLLTGIAK